MDASPQPDLNDILRQAHRMQERLEAVQAELTHTEVVGTAGGGVVSIRIAANGEAREVHIEPRVMDPDHPGELERLVLIALLDAANQIRRLADDIMQPMTDTITALGRVK